MHPWIKSDQPGNRCTICGMELVAVTQEGTGTVDPDRVTLNAAQAAVTGVQTSPVIRGTLTRTLRVSGVIEDDDTRHRTASAAAALYQYLEGRSSCCFYDRYYILKELEKYL